MDRRASVWVVGLAIGAGILASVAAAGLAGRAQQKGGTLEPAARRQAERVGRSRRRPEDHSEDLVPPHRQPVLGTRASLTVG